MSKRDKPIIITIAEDSPVENFTIKELAEKYAAYSDASIIIDSGYYGHGTKVSYTRLETEDETKARLVLEAVEAAKQKLKDERTKDAARKEFERLKKTYGFK